MDEIEITEDIEEELVTMYCTNCEEEYTVPESTEICPFCDQETINY